jgi:hypothetical protein
LKRKTSMVAGYERQLDRWTISEELGVCSADDVIVPLTARFGNEVWVLFGARLPVLLELHGKDTYSFLGETVVLQAGKYADVMYGAALAWREVAGVERVKEIYIS